MRTMTSSAARFVTEDIAVMRASFNFGATGSAGAFAHCRCYVVQYRFESLLLVHPQFIYM